VRLLLTLLALHAVYWLHGVIATCVAHQYSIVKDQRLLFRSQESEPFGLRLLMSEHRESRKSEFKNPRRYSTILNSTILNSFLYLVGLGRVELPTSPLSGVRSSQLSYRPVGHWPSGTGGAGRDRTGDLLNANQALSQLSYSPWLAVGNWPLAIGAIPQPKTNSQPPTPSYVSRPIGRCRPAPGRTGKVSRRT
jgi:hypothetical protein